MRHTYTITLTTLASVRQTVEVEIEDDPANHFLNLEIAASEAADADAWEVGDLAQTAGGYIPTTFSAVCLGRREEWEGSLA